MTQKGFLDDQANALLVQKHQLDTTNDHLATAFATLDGMALEQRSNDEILDGLLADAQRLVGGQEVTFVLEEEDSAIIDGHQTQEASNHQPTFQPLALLSPVEMDVDEAWSSYLSRVENYSAQHDLTRHQDPFIGLMNTSQCHWLSRA